MALNDVFSCEVIDSANLHLKGLITNDFLDKKKNKIANNISRTVKLDGFRKGRVPLDVVNARFGDKIKIDAEQEALSNIIENTMKNNNLELDRMLGNPVIKKYDKSDDGIDVEVQIGMLPTIVLDDYFKLIPDVSLEPVADDDVDRRLLDIAKTNGPLLEVDRHLDMGDVANIDFEGLIDDMAFDGGKSEGFDLEIGSKRFITGFEDQLIGMKKGDYRNINVKFPENYNSKDLAGKDAVFKVKLNKVQERSVAIIDDNFAKNILPNDKQANLEKLKSNIKIQLQNENKNRLFNELKKPLVDSLLNGVDFDLPKNIIEQELDMIFRDKLSKLDKDALKELQDDKVKAKEERENLTNDAIRSVKLTLIIDFLAKKLNISVNNDDANKMLYYEALVANKDPKELLNFYEQNNMIPALKIALLEGKVLNNLLESKLNS